jgi:xylose isomerase
VINLCQVFKETILYSVNFDAKIRRNSTDPADLFYAHIGGMDSFARALIAADQILQKSDYTKIRANRYASFDTGNGQAFENGNLSLTDLRDIAAKSGVPEVISGKQEFLENLINRYI